MSGMIVSICTESARVDLDRGATAILAALAGQFQSGAGDCGIEGPMTSQPAPGTPGSFISPIPLGNSRELYTQVQVGSDRSFGSDHLSVPCSSRVEISNCQDAAESTATLASLYFPFFCFFFFFFFFLLQQWLHPSSACRGYPPPHSLTLYSPVVIQSSAATRT